MVHRTLMDFDNSYSLDPWSDSSQDFDDSSRAGHGSSQAYDNSHAGHGSTFSLMHDGFMDWENVVTPTQSPIPAVWPPIPAQSTPIQSPSPVQSPTPVRPQRNAILSNISMHADNSPNRLSLHTYPPTKATSSQSTNSSIARIRQNDGTVKPPSSSSVNARIISPAVSTSNERLAGQGDMSAEASVFGSTNHHSPSASTEVVLRDKQLPGQSSSLSAAEDATNNAVGNTVNPEPITVEDTVSPFTPNGLLTSNNGLNNAVNAEQTTFENQEQEMQSSVGREESGMEVHPPGYLASVEDGDITSFPNFTFRVPNNMFDIFQSRMASISASNWNWGVRILPKRRAATSRELNKVRLVPSPSVVDAVQEAREAAFQERRQEEEILQQKINDQQMVINTLRSRLQVSEDPAITNATETILEASKKAKDRLVGIQIEFAKKHSELDEQYRLAIEEAVNKATADIRASFTAGTSPASSAESNAVVENDIEMHTVPPTQNSSFIPSSMLADNVRTSHEAQVNDYRPRNIGYSSRPPSRLSSRPPSRFSSVEPVSPSERHSSLPPTRRFRPSVSSRVIGPSLVAIEETEEERRVNSHANMHPHGNTNTQNHSSLMNANGRASSEAPPINMESRSVQQRASTLGLSRNGKLKRLSHTQLEEEIAGLDRSDHNTYHARVRNMFKDLLGISQDDDFINHLEADPETIFQFEGSGEPMPDLKDIRFDLLGDPHSIWNTKIIDMLRLEFLRRETRQLFALPTMSDDYIESIISDRISRLKTVWMRGMRQRRANGTVENDLEVEARLMESREERLKGIRHRERRSTKYKTRKRIVEGLIDLNRPADGQVVRIWEWLGKLIDYLGVDGMSSEESEEENHRTVYRVKIMNWRRDMVEYLELIDKQRHQIPGLFRNAGSKGVDKRRGQGAGFLHSEREAVKRLPRTLYNDRWFESIGDQGQLTLKVSKQRFDWLRIHGRML